MRHCGALVLGTVFCVEGFVLNVSPGRFPVARKMTERAEGGQGVRNARSPENLDVI